ncbi:hypothetical protein D3C84_860300 [compost metagenome]
MTAPWIDDDHRRFSAVNRFAGAAENLQQRVIDRAGQVCTGDHSFMIELEQQRISGPFVRQGVVAALTQGVPEQHAALAQISEIFLPLLCGRLSQLPET